MPPALGVLGRERQLGFDRVRPWNRSTAARPYDGPAPWYSRTCREPPARKLFAGGVVVTVERLGRASHGRTGVKAEAGDRAARGRGARRGTRSLGAGREAEGRTRRPGGRG